MCFKSCTVGLFASGYLEWLKQGCPPEIFWHLGHLDEGAPDVFKVQFNQSLKSASPKLWFGENFPLLSSVALAFQSKFPKDHCRTVSLLEMWEEEDELGFDSPCCDAPVNPLQDPSPFSGCPASFIVFLLIVSSCSLFDRKQTSNQSTWQSEALRISYMKLLLKGLYVYCVHDWVNKTRSRWHI